MKIDKRLLFTAIIFLMIVNTSYYWEGKLGLFTLPAFLILVFIYLVLVFTLLGQCYHLIRENFKLKTRLVNLLVISFVIILTFSKPYVFLKNFFLMEYVDFEDDNVLVAARYSGYSDLLKTETFKLNSNFTFKEKNVIYGLSEMRGTYRVVNDTIYFDKVIKGKQEDIRYEFGVIEELEFYTENKYALKLCKNKADTIGFHYSLLKNDLNIEPIIKPNR